MDVLLHRCDGIPDGCMFSVKAGPMRRQAPFESGRPLKFSAEAANCNEIQLDILEILGQHKLVLTPTKDRYEVKWASKSRTMTCEVEVRRASDGLHRPVHGREVSAKPPSTKGGQTAAGARVNGSNSRRHEAVLSAERYMERHSIVEGVQNALQRTMSEKPVDPFKYMAAQLLATGTAPASVGEGEHRSSAILDESSGVQEGMLRDTATKATKQAMSIASLTSGSAANSVASHIVAACEKAFALTIPGKGDVATVCTNSDGSEVVPLNVSMEEGAVTPGSVCIPGADRTGGRADARGATISADVETSEAETGSLMGEANEANSKVLAAASFKDTLSAHPPLQAACIAARGATNQLAPAAPSKVEASEAETVSLAGEVEIEENAALVAAESFEDILSTYPPLQLVSNVARGATNQLPPAAPSNVTSSQAETGSFLGEAESEANAKVLAAESFERVFSADPVLQALSTNQQVTAEEAKAWLKRFLQKADNTGEMSKVLEAFSNAQIPRTPSPPMPLIVPSPASAALHVQPNKTPTTPGLAPVLAADRPPTTTSRLQRDLIEASRSDPPLLHPKPLPAPPEGASLEPVAAPLSSPAVIARTEDSVLPSSPPPPTAPPTPSSLARQDSPQPPVEEPPILPEEPLQMRFEAELQPPQPRPIISAKSVASSMTIDQLLDDADDPSSQHVFQTVARQSLEMLLTWRADGVSDVSKVTFAASPVANCVVAGNRGRDDAPTLPAS
eukprot:TRINITY_DN13231_c0_g2_i1.p1 TRINITY_DN13231_c0_g2~~TRINITY_DN13231_c0_g2_i1.p1  ORF type:complete len:736 (+),score=161.31 TRINITY_DN13231_c0_g2_i1:85-2292(+)